MNGIAGPRPARRGWRRRPAGARVWRVGAAVSQFAFGTDSARDSAGRVAVLPAAPRPLAADAVEARPRADKFTLIFWR
ncbi:hypothetical protein CBM2592_B10215 [Cupriavidus taiwanensis]|nr:hypothetical protein CBM2588_B10209 [Cupriavidus taiwanensis]SOY59951.1 hypothetical protein CBM2592_B10215 [Cupriavidus taiwanensis]SOY92006.1 hypothetical protein CBM2591_B10213 [Cupriavidus taiwanensis]SOZ26842.1 hypothetical protein CBM2608_B10009 [Cupriavidus taiwanensis]SOZ65856.1 hypothetical protein CBM2617_B10055 [Cupriavidus taiwanensis]